MFADRKDAGRQLGHALNKYKGHDALVLAIPRGGVEVGYYVAEELGIPLSLVVVRKLPWPYNPESGFGAVAEDGSVYFIDRAESQLHAKHIEEILTAQKKEVKRRIEALRNDEPLPEITGKTVILVDDGIAMGSTMRAAIKLCHNKHAASIVVAAPVAGPDTAADMAKLVDDVVILEIPPFFRAVAEVYQNWYDVPDEEVIALLSKNSTSK